MTASAEDAECAVASSDFSKHSQNSLSKGEPKVDPGEAKVTFGDRDGQGLVTVSEFRELSPNLRVQKVQKAHIRSNTQNLCALASPANIRRIR